MHRIHIVGVNPRTGTTLMAECMRLCFEIDRAEAHEGPVWQLKWCRGVSVSKQPGDLARVGSRLRLDPRFYCICMMRDPRDAVVSKHGLEPDVYWKNTSLARFRDSYRRVQRLSSFARFIVVRYEDLIARPDDVQDELCARMPFLRRKGKFSDFHLLGPISEGSQLALNGVRPINPHNRGKWQHHTERLRDMLEAAGPIDEELLALGYESDPDWMSHHGIVLGPTKGLAQPSPAVNLYETRKARKAAIISALCSRLGIPLG